MFDWIKNIGKEVPEFWKTYLTKFDTKTNRFVIICCETSGSNPEKDSILSIAAIAVVNSLIEINDSFEIKINYQTEIIKVSKSAEIKELNPFEAMQEFIEFIGNAKLIGYKINYEIEDNTLFFTFFTCTTLSSLSMNSFAIL